MGSFLNVCIHRIPRGESIVSPPSHCPHCGYSIPWYLNIPLVTWLWLGGKCANCKAGISARYFLVELLTGVAFAVCWICFSRVSGHVSPALPLVYCLMISGLIAATFIDIEHLIIPDQFTFGGMVAGLFCSFSRAAGSKSTSPTLAPQVPARRGTALELHWHGRRGGTHLHGGARSGKPFLGKRAKMKLPPDSRIIFTRNLRQTSGRRISL